MPIAYIFNDNLQGYSPGNGVPSGFFENGITFDSEFILGSASPTPSPIGYYENTGIYYVLFGGPISFPVNSLLSSYGTATTTVAWQGIAISAQVHYPGSIVISAIDPFSLQGPALLKVQFQADNSVSLLAPGATTINSLVQSFTWLDWQFYSLTASYSAVGGFAVITASLYLNNIPLISGAVMVTTFPVTSLWNTLAPINQWNFQSGVYGYLGATSDIQPLPFYPSPVTPRHAKATQMMAELINLPSPGNARVSQIISEFANLPSPPNARVSQLIVEIIQGPMNSNGRSIWMDADASLKSQIRTWTDG